MFTKEQHLAKSESNTRFAAGLDLDDECGASWALTVIFYAAVHIVQAYFSTAGVSYTTHKTRANAIQREPAIQNVYDDYRELENLSREARYECSILTKGHVNYARECLDRISAIVYPYLE